LEKKFSGRGKARQDFVNGIRPVAGEGTLTTRMEGVVPTAWDLIEKKCGGSDSFG
jgi:hypothetical protein